MSKKTKIMFLCTGNSCRSQMAEGLAKKIGGNRVEVFSAGLEAHGVNPRAIKVMAEIGIDISQQTSDEIDPILLSQMDYAMGTMSIKSTTQTRTIPHYAVCTKCSFS